MLFRMPSIRSEIETTLHVHGKTPEDVLYVSYVHKNESFYCDYQEFAEVAQSISWAFDLSSPYAIHIVGFDWWITPDMHGVWRLHTMPIKPGTYKTPDLMLLRRTPGDGEW